MWSLADAVFAVAVLLVGSFSAAPAWRTKPGWWSWLPLQAFLEYVAGNLLSKSFSRELPVDTKWFVWNVYILFHPNTFQSQIWETREEHVHSEFREPKVVKQLVLLKVGHLVIQMMCIGKCLSRGAVLRAFINTCAELLEMLWGGGEMHRFVREAVR